MFFKNLKEAWRSFCSDLRFIWSDRNAGIIGKIIFSGAFFILFFFNIVIKEEN